MKSPTSPLLRLAMVLVLSPCLGRSDALADPPPILVTPNHAAGWIVDIVSSSDLGGPTGTAQFIAGPATPPLGAGSLKLDTGTDSNGGVEVRNLQFTGRKLADLTALSYATYVLQNQGCQAPVLSLLVDRTGDGIGDESLIFEPCYQLSGYGVPDQGPVRVGQWQSWNALVGGWWIHDSGPPVFTLQSYLAANLGATIVNSSSGRGGMRMFVGLGVSYSATLDQLTVGFAGTNTTYDFDPAPPPDLGVAPDLQAPRDLGAAPDLAAPGGGGGCSCRVADRAAPAPGTAWAGAALLLLCLVRRRSPRVSQTQATRS